MNSSQDLEGTYLFTLGNSRKGYTLNKMCASLNKEENRRKFKENPRDYYKSYNLPQEQIEQIENGDWLSLMQAGGSIYMLLKLGHLVGTGLYEIGAKILNMTPDEFMATRASAGVQ